VTDSHLAATYDRVAAHLVGRERELTLVLAAVAAGRDIILEGPPGTSKSTAAEGYPELVYDAMVVALSGRIFLDETVDATREAVLRQIWEDQLILSPAAAAPG
jgi:hypothetical protein